MMYVWHVDKHVLTLETKDWWSTPSSVILPLVFGGRSLSLTLDLIDLVV